MSGIADYIPINTNPKRWITMMKTRIKFKEYLKQLESWTETDTLYENIIKYYEDKIKALKEKI